MGLQRTHLHAEDAFALCREGCEDIALQAPQHVRFELFVQLLNLLLMVLVSEVKFIREVNW